MEVSAGELLMAESETPYASKQHESEQRMRGRCANDTATITIFPTFPAPHRQHVRASELN